MYTRAGNECSWLYGWTARGVWDFLLFYFCPTGLTLQTGFQGSVSDYKFLQIFLSWNILLWDKYFFNISKGHATPAGIDVLSSVQDTHSLFYQVKFFIPPRLLYFCRRATCAKVLASGCWHTSSGCFGASWLGCCS